MASKGLQSFHPKDFQDGTHGAAREDTCATPPPKHTRRR